MFRSPPAFPQPLMKIFAVSPKISLTIGNKTAKGIIYLASPQQAEFERLLRVNNPVEVRRHGNLDAFIRV